MKSTALAAITASITAMIVSLGLWFAPTQGSPTFEENGQLMEVHVVDQYGDPVSRAQITVERMEGGTPVDTRLGGKTDGAGERAVEMPVTAGRYIIEMQPPAEYEAVRDDADGDAPGPNGECGDVKRCVLLDVDAAGRVSIPQTAPVRRPASITFHTRLIEPPTLITVSQLDLDRKQVPGGVVTLHGYKIVEVDGKRVAQWEKKPLRAEMTTSSKTFQVKPDHTYVIRWEPPADYIKIAPNAPCWCHEVGSGPKGTRNTWQFFVYSPPKTEGPTGTAIAPETEVEHDLVPGGAQQLDTPSPTTPQPEQSPQPEQLEQGEQPQQGDQPQQVPADQTPTQPGSGASQSAVPTPAPGESGAATSAPISIDPDTTPEETPESEVVIGDAETELVAGVDAELEAELAAELAAETGFDAEAVTEAPMGQLVIDGGELTASVGAPVDPVVAELAEIAEADPELAAELAAELGAESGTAGVGDDPFGFLNQFGEEAADA